MILSFTQNDCAALCVTISKNSGPREEHFLNYSQGTMEFSTTQEVSHADGKSGSSSFFPSLTQNNFHLMATILLGISCKSTLLNKETSDFVWTTVTKYKYWIL